jgi:DNA modification methylase
MTEKNWKNRITGYGEESPDQLLANPHNHRIHPKRQQDALGGSLDTLGYIQTVIVNRATGHIVDGHLRVTMALREGQKSIPVTYVELTAEEEAQALLSLDPIAAMAATDKDKVDELLRMVNTDNEQVMKHLTDFAAENKLEWGQPEQVDAEPEIDRAAELAEKWQTASGQLWKLGEHRLLIGDCTVRENVERLMGGESAVLMVTDPPYGVDYGELVRGRENQKKDGWDDIKNDALSDEDLQNLLTLSLHGAGANVGFVFHPPGERRWLFWTAVKENGWSVSQEIVWVKNAMVFGRADYQWRHEPCLYIKKDGARKKQEDRTQTTVWEIDKPHNSIHPTQKPVELFEIAIRNHTENNELVYEPFAGSGTTIIAAHNLNRRCYAMEISEKYGAVILERFATATGIMPELLNQGSQK